MFEHRDDFFIWPIVKEPGKKWDITGAFAYHPHELADYLGGYIDVSVFDDIAILSNRYSRRLELPFNCEIDGEAFYGPVVLLSVDPEDRSCLTSDVLDTSKIEWETTESTSKILCDCPLCMARETRRKKKDCIFGDRRLYHFDFQKDNPLFVEDKRQNALAIRRSPLIENNENNKWRAFCPFCGLTTKWLNEKELAISRWNNCDGLQTGKDVIPYPFTKENITESCVIVMDRYGYVHNKTYGADLEERLREKWKYKNVSIQALISGSYLFEPVR